MNPNMDDETGQAQQGPDDASNKSDSDGVDFSSLTPEQQKQILMFVMQGKPQTPANLNQARNLLMNDPETVASLCDKLGIDPNGGSDDNSDDEGNDDADNG